MNCTRAKCFADDEVWLIFSYSNSLYNVPSEPTVKIKHLSFSNYT